MAGVLMGDGGKSCTLLVRLEKRHPEMGEVVKGDIQYGDTATKVRAMKKAILLIINGDTFYFRDLSDIIVRIVLPCEDLTVQKLALLYLETVYKGENIFGRIPPDTALVRDHLRKNLLHGDEYIRGITLRFLSRLRDRDLLDPLVECILVNLYHRHRFVRRHAYSAAFAIYFWLPSGRELLPDAIERVEHALPVERDAAATRNAFFMLCVCDRERAIAYLLANADNIVARWPDMAQMVAIDLMRGDCRCCLSKRDKDRFVKIIMSILTCSNSNSLIYEAADALLSLCSEPLASHCSDPVAVRAATNAYSRLLALSNDKEVEGIVLDRLNELRISHSDVVMDLAVDTIGSPDPSVMKVKKRNASKKKKKKQVTTRPGDKVLLEELA